MGYHAQYGHLWLTSEVPDVRIEVYSSSSFRNSGQCWEGLKVTQSDHSPADPEARLHHQNRNCSPRWELRWHEDGVSVECGADGLEDGEAAVAAGIDDGPDGGEELAAPLGTETVGHLAEDDTGTQRPFGSVVGIGDRLGGVFAVLQAPVLDSLSFNPFSFQ